MPSASILTKTSDQTITNPTTTAATINITWDTETKYLDAALDFHDSGTNPERLTIPASMDGDLYEVFIWVEDAAAIWQAGGNGAYLGLLTGGGVGAPYWWGIYRDTGKMSRGYRTGLVQANALEGYFYSACREFGTVSAVASASRCRFGIIQGNPTPRAFAAAREGSWTYATGTNVLYPSCQINVGNVYRGGTFRAPKGATLAAPQVNGYITSETNSSDSIWDLLKNGSVVASFNHAGSLRGYGPGTFGLIDVVEGDELEFQFTNNAGFNRTGNLSMNVEFW